MSSDANNPSRQSPHGPRLVPPPPRHGSVWEDLLSRVALGDQAAFETLYDESNPLIFGLVLRIVQDRADAEEIAFDVYSQVWQQASRYDRTRSGAAGWMVMIARSRALDHVRSAVFRSKARSAPVEDVAPLASRESRPDEDAILKQRRVALNEALAELSEDHRQLVELAFFEGLSHSELAAKTGMPLGTVKTRIRGSLARLRAALGGIRGSG